MGLLLNLSVHNALFLLVKQISLYSVQHKIIATKKRILFAKIIIFCKILKLSTQKKQSLYKQYSYLSENFIS